MRKLQKTKLILLLIFVLLIPNFLIIPSKNNSLLSDENNFIISNDGFGTSDMLPDFNTAVKVIGSGTQHDPTEFDYTYIQSDDGLVDDTMFSPGWGDTLLRDVADYGVVDYTGAFGSTDAGLWHFTDAYRNNDGKYLYLDSTWGNDYPGWIFMKWGAYGNIPTDAHPHVNQIRISYEVWGDSALGVLDQSTNLRIYAFDDLGNSQWYTIASNPQHRVHYEGTFTLTSGTVFNRVRAGGYVKHLAVYMYSNEELWTHTWINVDYVKIYYDFDKPDVNFAYYFDFSGYGLTTVTQFQLEFEVTELVPGTNVYLYDYTTSSWDLVMTINSAGTYAKNITIDADHYFSGTKVFVIDFSRFNYYDGRPYTQYHIKIDYVTVKLPPPDPPANLHLTQDILQIRLDWDPPNSYGALITHYNIYRGTIAGGSKTLIDTTPLTAYNDTTGTVGVEYYYMVTAESVEGESENSTEVSGKSFDQPFVRWTSPEDYASVVFAKGEPVTFSFDYDWGNLQDVELIIEKGVFSVNHGSVWNKTSIDIYEINYLDGSVTCTLNGYNNSILVSSDVREFTFVKIVIEVGELINSSTEILGKQLYMILHDPHGDNSYSFFEQSTQLSLGVGMELITAVGVNIEVGETFELFGVETGASLALSFKTTMETGYDFRYEITDTTSLTSSQVTDNPDYIGPGYGDRYWGESWILKWVLNATYRVYSNGTDRYEDPKYYWGIIRDVDTFCSHEHAPEAWREQNPVYNHTLPVHWLGTEQRSGGAPFNFEHEVTSTVARKQSLSIDVGTDFQTKFPGVETSFTFEFSMKSYVEAGASSTFTVGYSLYDDDPTDFIVHGVGIDKRFGTYIFNSSEFMCETSGPYEYHTFDYLPPEIMLPEIELDPDGDGISPSPDDSPIVNVRIFEEDELQEVIIKYSINNGTDWSIAYMSELPGDPGTWEGMIPSQAANTTVLWFIQAWDMQGHNATRYNSYLEPFSYVVIAKPEPDRKIPGYPLQFLTLAAVAGSIWLIHSYRKLRK
ncbi:MAG: fibronectin type III domain-containing protein [Candidatus Lokiarchaeota archaeon]|nr:fibronectin type III domain-containing protein [Candidatus Lokiarchaeota archaeon]